MNDMHPVLARVAQEVEKTRWAAIMCDADWRLLWVSTEMKVLIGEDDEEKLGLGRHILENWMSTTWSATITPESQVASFVEMMPYILADSPGAAEALKAICGEEVDLSSVEPVSPPPVVVHELEYLQPGGFAPTTVRGFVIRLYDQDGSYLGCLELYGSALPARILALVARGDEGMFERMANLVEPGKRQAAILFADLQESGVLSRRLPSGAYFKLVAAITSAMDQAVVDNSGIVGRHAGDGATAFFIVDDLGSPSGAAAAALRAARTVSSAVATAAKEVADETGLLEAADLVVNVGIHWGGTLYMGQLVTGGRLEVTALGDAVNECARIQESARGGEVLGSKVLVEHLGAADAAQLGIDPDALVYRTIAELEGSTDKARRDAGTIPVTVL